MYKTTEPILLESNQNHATIQTDGVSTTLPASMGMGGGYTPMITDKKCVGTDLYNVSITGDKATTLTTNTNATGANPTMIENNAVVRRLTPMECERLQGYPDGWTDIGDWVDSKGKTHKGESDSPRYKALGNSIALPFWEWMAAKMVKVLKDDGVEHPTMASLFDGIGGFPLVYSRCGCEPVWASEIEDFPIAVTKMRFKDDN